jgi:hypothetical protein
LTRNAGRSVNRISLSGHFQPSTDRCGFAATVFLLLSQPAARIYNAVATLPAEQLFKWSPRIQPDLVRRAVRSTQGNDASSPVYLRYRMNRERFVEHFGVGLDCHALKLTCFDHHLIRTTLPGPLFVQLVTLVPSLADSTQSDTSFASRNGLSEQTASITDIAACAVAELLRVPTLFVVRSKSPTNLLNTRRQLPICRASVHLK